MTGAKPAWAAYLRRNGYRIEASQFRCRMGEVDLIASRDGVLCFVEVKTRAETEHGLPRDLSALPNSGAFALRRHSI